MQLHLRAGGAQRGVNPGACCRRSGVGRRLQLRTTALLKQAEDTQVSWSQTTDDVLIKVAVPPNVRGKDFKFDIHPKRLSLRFGQEPLLEGPLTEAGEVSVDDCYWTLETETDAAGVTSKHVAITLAKRNMGFNSWSMLLESDKVDKTITDRCFLELAVGGQPAGKVAVGLFGNVVPKTVANFKALVTGSEGEGSLGKPLHYKGSTFHRVIPGFMAQGGDITANNGTGGDSIYGPKFADENFKVKHEEAGYLAMANAGPDTNSSQFYILFKPAAHLDGKHVVFGRIMAGMDVVRRLESLGSAGGQPRDTITITDCGLLDSDAAVDALMQENKLLQLDLAVPLTPDEAPADADSLEDFGPLEGFGDGFDDTGDMGDYMGEMGEGAPGWGDMAGGLSEDQMAEMRKALGDMSPDMMDNLAKTLGPDFQWPEGLPGAGGAEGVFDEEEAEDTDVTVTGAEAAVQEPAAVSPAVVTSSEADLQQQPAATEAVVLAAAAVAGTEAEGAGNAAASAAEVTVVPAGDDLASGTTAQSGLQKSVSVQEEPQGAAGAGTDTVAASPDSLPESAAEVPVVPVVPVAPAENTAGTASEAQAAAAAPEGYSPEIESPAAVQLP